MDYYLIPGADWSLLKKGDTVRILGMAGSDRRWYRCMAHREVDVKIPDLSLPPASIVNDLLPGTIIGNGNKISSGVQPQVTVEEESLDDVAREEEMGECVCVCVCVCTCYNVLYILSISLQFEHCPTAEFIQAYTFN